LTRGRAAATDPFDLSAVRRSDDLFDALATRRLVDPGSAEPDDPAAGLLAALVADVDGGAPPLPAAPARVPCGATSGGSCRRGVRAIVTFGVAAVVLTSAGAAAAGGNSGRSMDSNHGSEWLRVAERSNENVRHQEPPGELLVRRKPAGHADDGHRGVALYDVERPDARSAKRGQHRIVRADKPPKDRGKTGTVRGNAPSEQGGNANIPKVESTATDPPPPRSYGPHRPPATHTPSPDDRTPVSGRPHPDGS
jgi:hypothetical protein